MVLARVAVLTAMRVLVVALPVLLALAVPRAARADEAPQTVATQKARVIFTAPDGVQGLSVKFDGEPVPVGAMTTRAFTIDPGVHTISATGIRGGMEVAYEARFQVEPGEFVRMPLPMTEVNAVSPQGSGCLAPSKTEEDVRACIAAKTPPKSGCGACLVSPAEPAPPSFVLLFPIAAIAAIARALTRKRTTLVSVNVRFPHPP